MTVRDSPAVVGEPEVAPFAGGNRASGDAFCFDRTDESRGQGSDNTHPSGRMVRHDASPHRRSRSATVTSLDTLVSGFACHGVSRFACYGVSAPAVRERKAGNVRFRPGPG